MLRAYIHLRLEVNARRIYFRCVVEERVENLVGALSLAVADDLLRAAQDRVPLPAPAAAISLVGHAPGMSIEQLSRATGLSHPGAVRLVDRLVRGGLLDRGRSAIDGRAVALALTPAGEDLSRRILSSRRGVLSRALAGLGPADREAFGRIAETMLRAMIGGEDDAMEVCRLCDPSVCDDCPVEAELAAGGSPGP